MKSIILVVGVCAIAMGVADADGVLVFIGGALLAFYDMNRRGGEK